MAPESQRGEVMTVKRGGHCEGLNFVRVFSKHSEGFELSSNSLSLLGSPTLSWPHLPSGSRL